MATVSFLDITGFIFILLDLRQSCLSVRVSCMMGFYFHPFPLYFPPIVKYFVSTRALLTCMYTMCIALLT